MRDDDDEDPVIAIDAQLRVLTAAREASRITLITAEHDAVADMGGPRRMTAAAQRATRARAAIREYSHEIDDLQTERRQLLPQPAGL